MLYDGKEEYQNLIEYTTPEKYYNFYYNLIIEKCYKKQNDEEEKLLSHFPFKHYTL